MDTLVGRRLGKYQLETLIGRGGMATVYRAHDTVLNRSVAIKVLEPSLTMDPKSVERFRREAVTAANLEHPNIVRVYDVQQEGNVHYIAMRYVQGTTLRDILQDNGPLPLETVVGIVGPVAQAIHYAHTHGVVHRDVKPGNILIEPDGSVALTDFGIARAGGSAQAGLTQTGMVMGTADYLAPEQISGRPAEPRSDIYSLGVVLFEMLTGVTPFAGENTASILYRQVHDSPPTLRSLNPRLPQELQPIMDRALAKNPSLRYSDALDLARDLEEVAHWAPASPSYTKKPVSNGQSTRYIARPTDIAAPPHNNGKQNGQAGGIEPYLAPPEDDGYGQYELYEQHPQSPRQAGTRTLPAVRRRRGGRRTVLVFALALLLVGALVLGEAAGILPKLKAGGQSGARFQAPGAVTYSGPVRQGNGPDIHVPRLLQPLSIDGNLSDWAGTEQWAVHANQYVTYQLPKGRAWGGPDDVSALFNYAWDDNNFYIAAIVTDNIHVQTKSTRGELLYHGDDLEMWFDTDLAGDFNAAQASADDFQLGLSPGDFAANTPEAFFWNPDRNPQRNALVTVKAQPRSGNGGYTLEAAVPWQAFGTFRPQAGGAIGFGASAGDNDNPDVPQQELMVSTAPRLQYKAPLTFGMLYF